MTMPEFKQLVNEVKREVHEVDVSELKQLRESQQDFALVDVREPEDWQKGTIPGAATIPRGILELNIDQVTTDKDKKIVLYCGGGSRSALAAYNATEDGIPQRALTGRWFPRLERTGRQVACASNLRRNLNRCAAWEPSFARCWRR
jgi:rhodanese-related sulfurtransferase